MPRAGNLDPRYVGSLASGLLLWAAFPPLDQGLAAWVALVPLLWVLRDASPRDAFRLGYLTGLLWFALTLAWITLFGVVTWVLLALVLAFYIGGFAAVFRWLAGRYRGLDLLLIPLIWTAVEVVRSTGPLGFPWALLGVSQHRVLPTLQLAALGGVHLVSLLVAAANAWFVELGRALVARPGRVMAGGLVVVALVLLGGVSYGMRRLQMPLTGSVRVAVLQPNVSPLRKGAGETFEEQLSLMERLTRDAARDAELILFPETAIPVNLFGPAGVLARVAAWAPDRVVVASSFEAGADGVRNTAVPIEEGKARGSYAKRQLIPFGEAGVTRGSHSDPIPTRLGPLGIAVCYESAFGEIARAEARAGAGMLLILTNDGWFGATSGPLQHAAYAPLRAVETGRPVARAANTGSSMVVDPLGRVRARLPLGVQGIVVDDLPTAVGTPYLRGGWLVGPAAVAAVILLGVPLAADAVRAWGRDPAFLRVVVTVALPGLVAALGPLVQEISPRAGAWAIPAALLLAAWVAGGGWSGLAFRPRGAIPSFFLGSGVVAALGYAMVSTYARYGFFPEVAAPPGGWIAGGAALLFTALAWEGWLRGAVFTAAADWRGPRVALVLSTLLPLAARPVGPPEVLIWSLFVGAVFGLIRWRTGDALGLAIPRAFGIFLLSTLTVLS